MITCKKTTWLLTVREDRKLTQRERFQMNQHLQVCSLCRDYQAQTTLIRKLLKSKNAAMAASLTEKQIEKLQQSIDNTINPKL